MATEAQDDLTYYGIQYDEISITETDLYKSLGFSGQWYVSKSDGRQIKPNNLAEYVGTHRARQYKRERDYWREKRRASRNRELDSTMSHAAYLFGLNATRPERAS